MNRTFYVFLFQELHRDPGKDLSSRALCPRVSSFFLAV